jgi:hypothetical protein
LTKTVNVTIRFISQMELHEEITQEEFDQISADIHCDDFVRVGNTMFPTSRVEAIYVQE